MLGVWDFDGLRTTPKLQALVYDILWRKVPESDARSVNKSLSKLGH